MKFINLIIILLLTVGCSNKKNIANFEKILGKENSETLTFLVNDFETDFLKKQYPELSTEMSYREFLKELENNSTGNWRKLSAIGREMFNKNNLKYEIYRIADSVWIEKNPDTLYYKFEKNTIKTKWKFLNENGEFEFGTSESSIALDEPKNEDSLINRRKKYTDINYVGKYRKALYSVADKNRLINEYLDLTFKAGTIDPRLIASKMLNSNVDLSDYFIKRLIITEILY
ncbi:hypothetical protein [uncultured Algibacter sp.]|uniref:hypothetical protein n=1 Tax=uncultured Algibacter sp. TaxID=298659 RepID=UPI0026272E7F|nr:hypothetical protein [uncultured Algibacter sp.]